MKQRPFLSIWFGNFFEPFYSDREATRAGIADCAALGFNSLNLDSKPWEDFFARYRGGKASQYVRMHEFIMAEAARRGLDYTCLALYLCGDNLYPNIRSVPPVRGEEPVRPNGEPMGTYKYWSPRAQATMVEHVKGLLKLYGKGMRRNAAGEIIMQTMFEPIPKPSFDAEGRQKYLSWLEKKYAGDIAKLNSRYRLSAKSFSELKPAQYWLRPEELNWVGCARPTREDFANRTPDFWRWFDNQTHLAGVLQDYLATIKKHWRALPEKICIEPQLHQWGYFFNPPGQVDWQTGQRALDIYKCAQHVDRVLFISAPLNAENRADAHALSVEGSIQRNANSRRPFTGGLYLGRHVNGDIYRVVPPAEAVATHIANGAEGLHIYGYSGLDDGGVMFKMDSLFKESLRAGNEWAAKVIPLLAAPRAREVAVLFPAEMSLYEPLETDTEGRNRMDLLGWYQQFTDLGWHVDIVHPDQVVAGELKNYRHLVIPTNSLYDLGDNAALEAAVKNFVRAGGNVFHGPHCGPAKNALGIREENIAFDCIDWDEEIIPHGWSTVAFRNGKALGKYIQSGQTAIAQTSLGRGKIFSFGFQYGHAYCRRTMPIVPPQYGKREMHPVVLLTRTPVEKLAGVSPLAPVRPVKGVEFARFGKNLVIVNHRASPVDIRSIKAKKTIHLVPAVKGWLAAHSAVFIMF
jgi:Beta-galactosidase trimerisation domain